MSYFRSRPPQHKEARKNGVNRLNARQICEAAQLGETKAPDEEEKDAIFMSSQAISFSLSTRPKARDLLRANIGGFGGDAGSGECG